MEPVFLPRLLVECDTCGGVVPIEEIGTHSILCALSIFEPVLLAAARERAEQEQEFLEHKVVRRMRDVDACAPLAEPEDADTECCICLEPLPKETRRTLCGHRFCAGCLEEWFEQSTVCPVCKRDLGEEGGYELVDSQTGRAPSNVAAPPSAPRDIRQEAENMEIMRSISRRLDVINDILNM